MDCKLIFDGDPGTDDAIALKLLSVSDNTPEWCVSTFGNMPWEYVNLNMHILVRAFGMNCKVACGAKKPYDGHIVSCGDFHGDDALAGVSATLMENLGISGDIIETSASIDELAGFILSNRQVTYIATGPLSTLANLLEHHPEVEPRINRLLVMGGGIDVFNMDGNKEYNFAGDGIAVQKVFDSSIDMTLFPLDITHRCAKLSREQIDSFGCSEIPWLKSLLVQNFNSNLKYGGMESAVLHDTLPVLYLDDPLQFGVEDMTLAADSGGHIERSPNGRRVHVAKCCPENLLYEKLYRHIFM